MTLTQTSTEYRDALFQRFSGRIQTNIDLARKLVSYQANKETPFYGWFKYREGFTSQLIHYLLNKVHPTPGILLDPFAGSGAALFGASSLGWTTCGIEVLPVGTYAIQAHISADNVDPQLFAATAEQLKSIDFASFYDHSYDFGYIAITRGAFPEDTAEELVGYIAYCNKYITDEHVRRLALFASFCILEDISYTRKDGQYLRWDARSNRSQGKIPFNKGEILSFSQAIHAKLDQMVYDLLYGRFFDSGRRADASAPQVIQGSCLEVLPTIGDKSIDAILTSPPYCNRYDYTRTYALELVYLGASHDDVTKLRQDMLSCTVENKVKREYIKKVYESLDRGIDFDRVEHVFRAQPALHEVLSILDGLRVIDELNNPNIVRMVRNYFYEMCFVVFEMSRVIAPGGHIIMVNDNVRYAGEEVPVDTILSSMAEAFGLIQIESGHSREEKETAASRWALMGDRNCESASMFGDGLQHDKPIGKIGELILFRKIRCIAKIAILKFVKNIPCHRSCDSSTHEEQFWPMGAMFFETIADSAESRTGGFPVFIGAGGINATF